MFCVRQMRRKKKRVHLPLRGPCGRYRAKKTREKRTGVFAAPRHVSLLLAVHWLEERRRACFSLGRGRPGRAWDRRRAQKGAEHIRFFGVACCLLRCLCGRACVGEGHAHGPYAYGPVLCGRLCAQCHVRIALWAPRAPDASLWGPHFVLAAASVSRFYRGRGRERARVVRDCSGGGCPAG